MNDGPPSSGATDRDSTSSEKYLRDTVTVQVTGTWADGTSRTVESGPVTVVPGYGVKS